MNWSIKNSLEINNLKCEPIHNNNPFTTYSISGVEVLVPLPDSFRDLGLIVDSDLKLRHHVQFVKTKSLKLIGFLFKTYHSNFQSLYIKFYLSFIIPIIDYCVIFYIGPLKSSSTIIESIQPVFTRRLFIRWYNSYSIPEDEEHLKLFGLNKLSVHIRSIELLIFYKLSKGMIICPTFLQFSERLPHLIVLSPITSSLIRNSFFHIIYHYPFGTRL